jgi:hypothetical protein
MSLKDLRSQTVSAANNTQRSISSSPYFVAIFFFCASDMLGTDANSASKAETASSDTTPSTGIRATDVPATDGEEESTECEEEVDEADEREEDVEDEEEDESVESSKAPSPKADTALRYSSISRGWRSQRG